MDHVTLFLVLFQDFFQLPSTMKWKSCIKSALRGSRKQTTVADLGVCIRHHLTKNSNHYSFFLSLVKYTELYKMKLSGSYTVVATWVGEMPYLPTILQ